MFTKKEKGESENIVIVSHKYVTHPDDDLILFLNKKKRDNVLHIIHSFSDAPDRCSYYKWYQQGKIYKEYRTKDYKDKSEIFIYLKEFFFTLKWIWLTQLTWDTYIGMDGLCVLWGNILRTFGKVKKTIFWAIDFVPQNRFSSKIKNNIYNWINNIGYMKSDQMWDLSPRMAEAREKYLGIAKKMYRYHIVVPYGVWTERIKKYRYTDCEQNNLVFMGHLIEKQGVQLVIQSLPEIIKTFNNFKFKVIGEGHHQEQLIQMAKELKVDKYCDFKGKISDHCELEDEIAKSCLAIAPYIKSLDKWTYYADPGKVKTYLACGVPVLLTNIPWNAHEIEKNKCGKIITEQAEEITNSILKYMNSDINQQYRDNAILYSQQFNYNNIFKDLNI